MHHKNIGSWEARVRQDGKTPEIFVTGEFPTNGEQPFFHLRRNDPRDKPGVLSLTLVFGELAQPGGDHTAKVGYSELLLTTTQYTSVWVVDPDKRMIALVDVKP